MRKFIVLSIVLLMIAGFAITSSAIEVVTLWAGQNIEVGYLTVEVVGDNLVVTYNIDDPWVLGETHLYVGTEPPIKSAPGRFPYGPEDVVEEGKYVIDLEGFTGTIYIAAQAEVQKPIVDGEGNPILDGAGNPTYQEETAWADGDPIRPGKNWAMYFSFTVVVGPVIS